MSDAPLKIAHVVRRFAFEEWGGTETVVWNTARYLVRCGVDSVIYATKACSAVGSEIRDGIDIRRFDYYYPYWPLSETARRALDKKGGNPVSPGLDADIRAGKYDLIHIHSGGRIAQSGTHEELLQQEGLYRRVYDLQSGASGIQEGGEAE